MENMNRAMSAKCTGLLINQRNGFLKVDIVAQWASIEARNFLSPPRMGSRPLQRKMFFILFLFKDAMPVSFRSALFTSYILTI